jgi:hypothetical protein
MSIKDTDLQINITIMVDMVEDIAIQPEVYWVLCWVVALLQA